MTYNVTKIGEGFDPINLGKDPITVILNEADGSKTVLKDFKVYTGGQDYKGDALEGDFFIGYTDYDEWYVYTIVFDKYLNPIKLDKHYEYLGD